MNITPIEDGDETCKQIVSFGFRNNSRVVVEGDLIWWHVTDRVWEGRGKCNNGVNAGSITPPRLQLSCLAVDSWARSLLEQKAETSNLAVNYYCEYEWANEPVILRPSAQASTVFLAIVSCKSYTDVCSSVLTTRRSRLFLLGKRR